MTSAYLSRRAVLRATAILGAYLALPKVPLAQAAPPAFSDLQFNPHETRTVAIVGSGIAGLTAAYLATRAGFRVMVLESDDRYGGRSLTVRPADPDYRHWWFDKYNPYRLFPRMYVSSYCERSDSPDPQDQVADFEIKNWPGTDEPVELFFNAGPGRIPNTHKALLDLCGEVNVRLEPFIFLSGFNLLSSEDYQDGKPVQWRAINYSLMGELATVMSRAVSDGLILKGYEEQTVQAMLKQFGDLQADGTVNGSHTVGFIKDPGGWQSTIEIAEPVSLAEILDSGFTGVGDLATSAGSFVFNPNYINWQPTLMQPVGGMDRIWQQLLLQPVTTHSLDHGSTGLAPPDFLDRDSGPLTGQRFVGDLVHLNSNVRFIDNTDTGVSIGVNGLSEPIHVDFCIVTAAPALLGGKNKAPVPSGGASRISIPPDMRITTNLSPKFKAALGDVEMVPAIKVGVQARYRFWEEEDQIFGGISWTTMPSSQIWYPSEDFYAPTGILTAAYNRGEAGGKYGELRQRARIRQAMLGCESIHSRFASKVYADRALTVAWQYMPGQLGGWANETHVTQPSVYKQITTLPRGRIYFAGDTYSQLPGWQEGAVDSARLAVTSIVTGLSSTDPKLYVLSRP